MSAGDDAQIMFCTGLGEGCCPWGRNFVRRSVDMIVASLIDWSLLGLDKVAAAFSPPGSLLVSHSLLHGSLLSCP